MPFDRARLRDHIVFLEAADARRVRMDARAYRARALALREAVVRELGALPMQAFMSEAITALETTAQNVFFEGHRRFADLDGSGNALRAQAIAEIVLGRLRRP